jgi:hypothetical protein
MPRINMTIRLGPMVHFEIQGESCSEIANALDGFERLNVIVDTMFTDLAQRVYPEAARSANGQNGERGEEGRA